jgi:hypothetical protein
VATERLADKKKQPISNRGLREELLELVEARSVGGGSADRRLASIGEYVRGTNV